MNVLEDVRSFLFGLRRELPEVFREPEPEPAPEAIRLRVEHWSGLMEVRYRAVRVKDQRTRWGSCSRQGNLNFNWRLTLAPPEILDYVVIHELAHLLELNHSRRFWEHVARWCPEHKERRRWLRKNGPTLFSLPRSRA